MSYQIYFADNGKGLIFKRSAGAAASTSDFEKAIVRFFQECKSALAFRDVTCQLKFQIPCGMP